MKEAYSERKLRNYLATYKELYKNLAKKFIKI